jgi:beta-lactamase class A
MPRRVRFLIFFTLAMFCLLAAAYLAYQQSLAYRATLGIFPNGSVVAGIPAGGLRAQEVAQRLAQAFSLTPVELQIKNAGPDQAPTPPVQIDPLAAGQQLDLGGILARATEDSTPANFWSGFWDYLWNRQPAAITTPLTCTVKEDQLRQYLAGLFSTRYDQLSTRAEPTLGDVLYTPGQPGQTLDIASALPRIRAALCSQTARTVELSLTTSPAQPPDPALLRPVLDTLIQGSNFDGVLELYFQDLQTGEEFTSAFNHGHAIEPGIAFTAASTIKIPVMVSVYKRLENGLPEDLRQPMEQMIDLSDNSSTDEVMQRVLDQNIGPMQVSEDMQALGLQNTFLAGFFYPGAPLLNLFKTPANQRSDINTDPDIYNQTTAADMGHLLADMQRCAADNQGPLVQAFTGQITQAECQEMITYLSKNKKGVLIEAGLPEGVHMARKYGWVTDTTDGLMHAASDATLVFTPGGNFVLTVYLYHPDQLQWDPAQRLVARLATAVNNYYNGWK